MQGAELVNDPPTDTHAEKWRILQNLSATVDSSFIPIERTEKDPKLSNYMI